MKHNINHAAAQAQGYVSQGHFDSQPKIIPPAGAMNPQVEDQMQQMGHTIAQLQNNVAELYRRTYAVHGGTSWYDTPQVVADSNNSAVPPVLVPLAERLRIMRADVQQAVSEVERLINNIEL